MSSVLDLMEDTLLAEFAKGIWWDPSIARYRDKATGHLVSEAKVLKLTDKFIVKAVQTNIETNTQRMIDGKITLTDWQHRVAKDIKDANKVAILAGRGGKNAMEQSDWGRLGGRGTFQYSKLNNFAQEIFDGKLTPKQVMMRAKQYARSARTLYFDGQRAAKSAAGYAEEMRVLSPAEHCDDCPGLAGYWAPVGTLPAIGQTQCMTNCKCTMRYRKTELDKDGYLVEVTA